MTKGAAIRTVLVLAAVFLALVLAGCAQGEHPPYPPGYTPDPAQYGHGPQGWARIAAGPLSARHGASAVWLDGRFVVFGGAAGTPTCTPSPCSSRSDRPLRDGAAYDPATDQWSRIAEAPMPIATAESVLLDSELYVLTHDPSARHRRQLLRYDPRANSWTRLAPPPDRPGHLLAEPGSLIDVADSSTGRGPTDFSYDADGNTWVPETLPPDPFGASHDRRLFWADGDLVLFARPGASGGRPSLTQMSTIWSSRGWSPPTTLPALGTEPVLVGSTTFVFPDRRVRLGSDGKRHPTGAIDLGSGWEALPRTALQPMTDAGITQTLLVGGLILHDGLLLDTGAGTYRRPPDFLGGSRTRAASAAGDDLFVWGGVDRRTGHELADGYLLYP